MDHPDLTFEIQEPFIVRFDALCSFPFLARKEKLKFFNTYWSSISSAIL